MLNRSTNFGLKATGPYQQLNLKGTKQCWLLLTRWRQTLAIPVQFAVHLTSTLGSSMPGWRSDFSKLGTNSLVCVEFLASPPVKVQPFESSNTSEKYLSEEMIQNAVGNPLDNLSFKDSRKYRKRLAKCEHNSQLSKTCSIGTHHHPNLHAFPVHEVVLSPSIQDAVAVIVEVQPCFCQSAPFHQ